MFIPWDDLEQTLSSSVRQTADLFVSASLRIKDVWKEMAWIHRPALRTFRPKVRVFIEKEAFLLKTVESSWELEAALRLRHEVFYGELLHRPSRAGFDMDSFDLACDHLILVEKAGGRVVGTYRVNSTAYSKQFYSNREFHLDEFLRSPGRKLELGRACIHKDYRNGLMLALLWKGIVQYAERIGADQLFGCSSIPTVEPYEALRISVYLEKNGHGLSDIPMPPRPQYRFPCWDEFRIRYEPKDAETISAAKRQIPPLLLGYLRAGAKVSVEPALDRAFQCVDFITVLETRMISASYERKFSRC